jgi:hypothetical protein
VKVMARFEAILWKKLKTNARPTSAQQSDSAPSKLKESQCHYSVEVRFGPLASLIRADNSTSNVAALRDKWSQRNIHS